MIVNVLDVLRETGLKQDIKGKLAFDNVTYLGEDFEFVTAPVFDGYIFNNGQSLSLKGNVSTTIRVNCARCMCAIEREFDYEIDETLIREDSEPDPDGEAIVFSGEEIDISDLAMNGFFVNVPGKFLCSEDCKGLCPECGTNLNEKDCGCAEDAIDPRWEALKNIMDNNKDN